MKESNDLYPFGMKVPDPDNVSPGEYRFGFNGMEQDDEIAGNGNSYTAPYWQYDPRIGRRWNQDPVYYHWQSSYATFNNNPIYYKDPMGLEGEGNGEDENGGGGDDGGHDNVEIGPKDSESDVGDTWESEGGYKYRKTEDGWEYVGGSHSTEAVPVSPDDGGSSVKKSARLESYEINKKVFLRENRRKNNRISWWDLSIALSAEGNSRAKMGINIPDLQRGKGPNTLIKEAKGVQVPQLDVKDEIFLMSIILGLRHSRHGPPPIAPPNDEEVDRKVKRQAKDTHGRPKEKNKDTVVKWYAVHMSVPSGDTIIRGPYVDTLDDQKEVDRFFDAKDSTKMYAKPADK